MVNNTGFTLVEVLLYSIFFTILVSINISLFLKFTATVESQDLKINDLIDANNIFNIISSELTASNHINSPQLYSSESNLNLSKNDALENPAIFEFQENNIFLKRGVRERVKINSSTTKIESILYSYKKQENVQILELELIINQIKYNYVKYF